MVDAFLAAALSEATIGRVYNIGGCQPVSLLELAELLVRIAGSGAYDRREFPAERKKIDIGDYVADDSAFRAVTGWRPRHSLDEGLAETLAFYRAHAAHYL